MKEVPVMVAKGWSDAKKRAYVLADNKLAINAGWDNEMLALELAEIGELGFDLDMTGFKAEEIKALQTPDFEPATEDEQGQLDELDPKWIACPHCGKEFDARQA
jgi:ParB-like chromosome segregation protein Spo0J